METNFDDFELPMKPSLGEVIGDLQSFSGPTVPASAVYGLSDLTESEISGFLVTWQNLSPGQRRLLIEHLTEVSESNIELSFQALGRLALGDLSEQVREAAVDLLWEDESRETLVHLVEMVKSDGSARVRAAAASAMERFVLLGEYGKVDGSLVLGAREVLMDSFHDLSEDIEVRRRALESVANSSHEEIPAAIEEAYTSGDPLLQQSAIYAMGRTADARWVPIVLRELDSLDPAVSYEAARAAGELELHEAVSQLERLAVEGDREVQEAAIWSLGEIGGRQSLRTLSALAQDAEAAEEHDLLEAIEDAIGNASLTNDILSDDED